MSTQEHDQFYYKDKWFDLTASNGKMADIYGLLGYRPLSGRTSCGRGYIAVYEILDNTIALGYLETSNVIERTKDETKTAIPVAINGVRPVIAKNERVKKFRPDSPCREVKYKDTALKLPFTGEIVIGDNLVWNRWGWFQQPWNYETVLELHFVDGTLANDINLSCLTACIRTGIGKNGTEDDKKLIIEEGQKYMASKYADKFLSNLDSPYGNWFKEMYA